MMQWSGDPYVDVGLATILAFHSKDDPAQLTPNDLQSVADWIIQNYLQDPLKSFLTVAFTSNAWFAQPSFTPEKKAARGQAHLLAWQNVGPDDERCIFTGLPTTLATLSDKLAPGRAARAQIPLTQGDEDINFYPNGNAGLPISGQALLCLQAFPLGCAKVGGRLLAVHASEPAITLAFAREFLTINRKNIALAQQAGETKMPETRYGIGTLLVDTLMKVIAESRYLDESGLPYTITAYHLTNGQAPEIAIYHLPLGVTGFLRLAHTPRYQAQWQRIVQAAWPRAPDARGEAAGNKRGRRASDEPPGASKKPAVQRNYLYEDVLRLPEDAPRFLRIYFLRHVPRSMRLSNADPRADYSTRRELALVSWDLTELFLREVMSMDKTRIEHIRALGDRLADYVSAENDRRFFRAFYGERNYALLRNALLKANTTAVRRTGQPLITFDQFIEVFEEGEDLARKDWQLARDLVLIRMIERLAPWLAGNEDVIPQTPADEADVAAQA